ncbi:hypothetical protein [Pseudomonas chlororaphis]|uniref:hypothetical protein n=1 Tax=Pseudomonas chlororaphis TaxID=587753 RepID=UPI000F579D8D|nr:hypothetical protein [Pseudomonas chlororaphis]AZD80981.1 hypothetical protein C4K15_4428 [Pseudomonas chlororaphis subsp. aurantiaca]
MLLRTISIKNAEQEVLNGAVLCSFAIPMLSHNFLAYSLNEGAEVGESRVYLAMLNKAGQSYSLSSIETEEDWRQVIQVFKDIVTHASLPEGRQQGAGSSTDIPYHLVDLKDCVIPTGNLSDHRSLTIKKNLVMKLISSEASVACLPAIDSAELGVPALDISISMASQDTPAAQAVAECIDEDLEVDVFDDVPSGFASIGNPEELSQKPEEVERDIEKVLTDASLFTESFQHDMTEMPTANAEKYVDSSESDVPLSGHLTPEVVADHSANSEADIGRLSQGIQSTLAGLAEVVRDLASEEEMKLIQSDEYDLSISDSVPTLMDRQVQATADIDHSAQVAGDVTPDEVADCPIPLESSLDEAQFLMATLPEAETALQGADTDHLLLDVESTLSNLALMAQELTQQKLVAVKQQEALELLKEQLQERERKLHEKDEHLRQLQSQLQQEKIAIDKSAEHNSRVIAERSAALQQLAESVESRERSVARRSELMQLEQQRLDEISAKQSIRAAELEKRDVGIQQKNAELVERLAQLSSTRKKLSNIVKGFNETVTFNNSLHSISSTLLSDDE